MNLAARAQDLLLRNHIAPVVKMQFKDKNGSIPKLTDCGLQRCTLTDGSKRDVQLWSWNGVPGIRQRFEGRDLFFVASVKQRKYRDDAAYLICRLPNDLRMPSELRGAEMMIRMTAPNSAENYPTRHIRWINEHEDLFWHLHGRRQDSESTNHRFKQTLFFRKNDRAHSHGRASVQFDLIGFVLLTNGIAAAEHAKLTGRWPEPLPPPSPAAESPPLAA